MSETTTTPTDLTGWCAKRLHESCDGTLRTGQGFHWWCACTCHPVPEPTLVQIEAGGNRALAEFAKAREANRGR